MKLLGWWNKKKMDKTVALQPNKDEKGICPECGGQGYSFKMTIVLKIVTTMKGAISIVEDVMDRAFSSLPAKDSTSKT